MKILYLLIATLKFLAVAILILLLLLLLLVIIILMVPIKYRVYINKSEQIEVDATVKWLYSIVSMDIIYNSNDEMIRRFKIFGKVIGPRKPKKVRKSKRIRKSKKVKEAIKTDDSYMKPIKDQKEAVGQRESIEGHPKVEVEKDKKDKKVKKTKKAKKEKKVKKEKDTLKERINKIQSFTYKKELVADTFVLIKKLLKHLLPSTLYTEIEIGKEDPADTGQLIAKLSAFYPIYYSFASFVGNYEKECFYVKLDASGDIIIGKLVYETIKYIRKTSVKQVIKFIRKDRKGKNHGRKTAK